jgi:transcription factor S
MVCPAAPAAWARKFCWEAVLASKIKMMFCPKCGSILMPKKEDGKIVVICKCGYSEIKDTVQKVKEVVKGKKEIEAVENEVEVYPTTDDAECPKCGHKSATFWEVQTRASDEPATKFMKCQKCKHIWRDYK